MRMLLTGDRRDEEAIAAALLERSQGDVTKLPDPVGADAKDAPNDVIEPAKAVGS
jgi:hypothetical protein